MAHSHRNLWRVKERLGDIDDCMQECAIVYLRVVRKYGDDTYGKPAQLMALYKKSVTFMFHDYSTEDTNKRRTQERMEADPDAFAPVAAQQMSEEPRTLSREARLILARIRNAPAALLDAILSPTWFGGSEQWKEAIKDEQGGLSAWDREARTEAEGFNRQLLNDRLLAWIGIRGSDRDVISELIDALTD